ncbi:MAG: hypothetical protein AAF921_11750 [Cyanobacteria bacterium P01_D01_bin.44]
MRIIDDLADCRYCSQVSKLSGEDPVGSAPQVDHWLLVELPQPWPISMFTENAIISQSIPLIKKLAFKRGVMVRPVAISPDPDYSKPGFARVIYYRRPAQQFAQYTKQEYVVPDDRAASLVLTLLKNLSNKAPKLSQFAACQQASQSLREIRQCCKKTASLAI